MLYIAENLRALRKRKDFTQEEIAEILSVSPQSVSKWERGDTMPDITMLPSLANLYNVSVDTLIGMEKINDRKTKNDIFKTGYTHLRAGDISAAADVFNEALKTFPNDEDYMSYLAMTLALDGDEDNLSQSIELCEQVLAIGQGVKTCHTTRAALCFIYMKAGDKEKAAATAYELPHLRESREMVLEHIKKDPSADEIDSYLKFIAIGGSDEQDVIEVDFGIDMVVVCTEYDLLGKIKALREEIEGGPIPDDGVEKLPPIRVRDNVELAPNHVRVRHLADYLLDKEYDDPAKATEEIVGTLREIAGKFEHRKQKGGDFS